MEMQKKLFLYSQQVQLTAPIAVGEWLFKAN